MNPSLEYINYSNNLNYYCNGTASAPNQELVCKREFTRSSFGGNDSHKDDRHLKENCLAGCTYSIGYYNTTSVPYQEADFTKASAMQKLDEYVAKIDNYIQQPSLLTFDADDQPSLMQPKAQLDYINSLTDRRNRNLNKLEVCDGRQDHIVDN